MEKLELRRDKERAADELQRDKEQAANQLKSQQLMIQMMQNMFQPPNTRQQQMHGTTPLQVPIALPLYSGQPVTTPTSTSRSESDADDLAASMNRTKLDTAESEKKRKTTDPMNLKHENNHPPLPLPPVSQQ